jgi:hyperosmotically inducible protein
MKKLLKTTMSVIVAGLVAFPLLAKSTGGTTRSCNCIPLEAQIRRELLTLSQYSLFDHLEFQINSGRVTLMGQTVRPTIKSSAERRVARLDGITGVDNRIEILPVSFYDDHLRLRVARAVYRNPILMKYAMGARPRIHIVVKNGRVTLEGVVNQEAEKHIAVHAVNGAGGAFAVTDNLRVDTRKKN